MANSEQIDFRSENDDIEVFLKKCDLLQFEEAFRREGVTKTCHFTDVTSEDLSRLGRFYRQKYEVARSIR